MAAVVEGLNGPHLVKEMALSGRGGGPFRAPSFSSREPLVSAEISEGPST